MEALAYHFRQAGEPARAAVYLEDAGDRAAAQFAYAAAADHYRDLMACLEERGRASDHLRAGEKLAGALSLMAHYDAALTVLEQVADANWASADAVEIGRIETLIAATYGNTGAFQRGIARLEPVVAALESSDPTGARAMAYLVLGVLVSGTGQAERALVFAERARDPGGIIRCMSRLGLSALLSGDWPSAQSSLERGMALAQEVGVTSGPTYATPRSDLARFLMAKGDWDEAARHCEAVLASYAGTSERVLTLVAHGLLAERDVVMGNAEAARARLLAVRESPGGEERQVTQDILPVLAWAHYELSELEQATATAEETIRRARRDTCRLALVQALRGQALVLVRQEHHDEAVRAIEESLVMARSMPYLHGEGRLLHAYGLLHARRGERAQARARLDAARVIFRRLGAYKDGEQTEQVLRRLD